MTRIEAQREEFLNWCNEIEYQLVLMWNDEIAQKDIFIQDLINDFDQCNKCLRDYLQLTKTLTDPDDVEREIKFLKSRLKDKRSDLN